MKEIVHCDNIRRLKWFGIIPLDYYEVNFNSMIWRVKNLTRFDSVNLPTCKIEDGHTEYPVEYRYDVLGKIEEGVRSYCRKNKYSRFHSLEQITSCNDIELKVAAIFIRWLVNKRRKEARRQQERKNRRHQFWASIKQRILIHGLF